MPTPSRNALAARIRSRRARFATAGEQRAFDEGMITGVGATVSTLVNTPIGTLRQAVAPMMGMGDFASSAMAALTQAGGALGTGAKVVSDPYLPEVLCYVDQLAQIEAGGKVTACPRLPAGRVGGIGLRKVVTPLRAYVYAEQHPWVYPVAIGAAIGIPFLLGYLFGK